MLVVGDHPRSIGFYSKYVRGHVLLPSPEREKQSFVAGVIENVRRYDIPFIYPVTETSLISLDEQRREVDEVATLLAPSSETIRYGVDKKLTYELARQEGLPLASTVYPCSVEEAEEYANSWGYPVVFKPRGRANDSRIDGAFEFKVHYAHTREELRGFLLQFLDGVYPMMQQYAFGGHVQFSCFVERGEDVHSMFLDDMVRMLPLTGGVGARRR